MTKRRQATLDVLVVIQDAFELNELTLPDAASTFKVTGYSEGTFEHAGWEMKIKLSAHRKAADETR